MTANDGEPVRGDLPVLLILGEADPQDPANVAGAPEELPRSKTVVVPRQSHTVGTRGCIPTIVTAFLTAGTVDGPRCVMRRQRGDSRTVQNREPVSAVAAMAWRSRAMVASGALVAGRGQHDCAR